MKTKDYFQLTLSVITLSVFLFSCSATKNYIYDIRLERPMPSKNLQFENDTFSISFTFNPKYIEFEMYNKLEDGIRINWDELSVSINGQAKRVVHYETGTDRVTETQPPTTIPPKSKLTDGLVATDKINYNYISGRRVISIPDTYPKTDYGNKKTRTKIMSMKGQKIVIYFPYYLRNIYQSKTFEFIIADIKTK
jgi:hypothetical protein